jgi:signal transduction histidine kinase/CheY-like chemotaxis protein
MIHPDVLHFVRVLPEPSFLVSGAGRVLGANGAAAAFAGVDARRLEGTDLAALVADPPLKVREYLRLCARSRQLVPGSFAWLTAGGRPLDTRCDGTVVAPRTADVPAVLFLRCRPRAEATDQFVLLNEKIAALSREVLERKKAEVQRDELYRSERAARVEAERNSRMKDEFLATLSHELRTPLNAIIGWIHLLRHDPEGTSTAEGLEVIDRNARAQKQLIEDLLEMSRIISGKVRLDVQRVEPARVIREAAEAVRPAADARSIRVQLTLDPLAGPVKGDPSRLQQIVWNLLSNAIKFTPKGGRVQVSLERVNSHVEVTVSDTGEGIAPEFLPHVFDRFRQADAATTRRHGGLGLGLSIVKQLVELHGGTVRAESPGTGCGATFTVALPLMVLHDEDGHPATEPRVHPAAAGTGGADPSAAAAAPTLAGVAVLVVDDEPDARDLVRRFLERHEARVTTAATAADALTALAEHRPDIVVSDIGIPDVDGYELMRRVRALPPDRGGGVPAVAVTAFARTEDRTRALLAGYNVHLSKPIEPAELVATVASLARLTARPR